MRIEDVETYAVGTPEPHKGGANWFFIKVTTDEGIEGWGECTMVLDRLETMATMFEELKDPLIVGFNPFDIENLRHRLYRSTHNFHVPGALQAQFVAATEMACWDIVGKAVGEPVYNLLGGKHNDRIRTYTYIHYEWDPPQPPEEAAAAARKLVDQGFTGIKIDPLHPIWGPRSLSLKELSYGEDVIAAIREEVGDECDILVGTHGQLDIQSAIRFGRRIEAYDPLWYEEPVPLEKTSEMAEVARKTTVPIATGERITTKFQFSDLLEQDAVHILQPDIGLTGILEAKKIAGMAETHYSPVAPWHYAGPVQGAANIQLDACIPNYLIQESIEDWEFFHNEIIEDPIEWEDGYITPPDRPGLGVVPDEEKLAEHPPNEMAPPWDRGAYSIEANRRGLGADATVDERFL